MDSSSVARLPRRIYQRDVVRGMLPLSLLQVLVSYLQSRGLEPAEVMPGHVKLDGHHHSDRISTEDYCQLLLQAAERLEDPLLGLHLGSHVQPHHLGALGYVLLSCESLGSALMRIQRYHPLVHDMNPMDYELSAQHVELRWGVSHGRPGALFDEAGIAGFVQLGRALCGRCMPVIEVDFVNPPPSDIRPYIQYFGCNVRFSQPITRLVLPIDILALPLRQRDPTLLRLMEAQADAAMAQLPRQGDLVDMTCQAIARLAPQGMPELQQVARELRMSPRIYYRRLTQQGLNFRVLRETALRQIAERHLRDDRLSLAHVSGLLGYSEQSAFSRAFKRWTGQTPLQWRAQH